MDPPGHHARHRGSGPHHPHPRAHDRDHQQAHPDLAPARAGAGPRAHAGGDRHQDGSAGGQGAQGAEDRAGAHLPRDADRRGGGQPPRRLHRGQAGRLARREHDRPLPARADQQGAELADAARGESAPPPLRAVRRLRAHPRGSRPGLRRHPRAHPPDRGQGAQEAAPSVALQEAPELPRIVRVLSSFSTRGPIAQLAEPPAHNRFGLGSSPSGPTQTTVRI